MAEGVNSVKEKEWGRNARDRREGRARAAGRRAGGRGAAGSYGAMIDFYHGSGVVPLGKCSKEVDLGRVYVLFSPAESCRAEW